MSGARKIGILTGIGVFGMLLVGSFGLHIYECVVVGEMRVQVREMENKWLALGIHNEAEASLSGQGLALAKDAYVRKLVQENTLIGAGWMVRGKNGEVTWTEKGLRESGAPDFSNK